MRLLIINPNTSTGVTQRIAQVASETASRETEVTTATAKRGVPYIATRTEAIIGAQVTLEMLAERQPDFDAAIIAAFGDPGIGGARELFPQPVVGLAEAGMLTACMMGQKFAIVTFSNVLSAWYSECVAWHGLEKRLAGIFAISEAFRRVDDVQEEKGEQLIELCHEVLAKSDADVIVLAGAPLAGLAATVKDRIPVPIIDCVAAAVHQAETLFRMELVKAKAGSFSRPASKSTLGLSSNLAKWIEGKESP